MKIRYTFKDYVNPIHTALGIDLITWFSLLRINHFRIYILYLPKVFLITLLALLNAPLQLLEYLMYSRRIAKTKVKYPVFILGHPRSGTTYLQYVLSRDPEFTFCTTTQGLLPHIFLLTGKFFEKFLGAVMPDTRPQDNVKSGAGLPIEEEFALGNIGVHSWVDGLYFPSRLNEIFDTYVTFKAGTAGKKRWLNDFDFFLRKLTLIAKGKPLLLKSPANTARLYELHERYPEARFIHIHRHPLEVYLSNERLYQKILPLLGLQKVSGGFVQEHVIYAYREMYTKYLNDLQRIPADRIVQISYQEFLKNPKETLQRTYAHLTLGDFEKAWSHLEQEINSAAEYQPNRYETIDPALMARLRKEWAFAFDAFGYS